jgi:hypothetical protein
MSWTTGAEMHVMMRSTVADSSRNVPRWWKNPVAMVESLLTGEVGQPTR